MATRRTTFSKTQRERDKREKAAAKRERRATAAEVTDEEPPQDSDLIIAQLAALQLRYDEGTIALEEFAARQEELRSNLRI